MTMKGSKMNRIRHKTNKVSKTKGMGVEDKQ